MSPRGQRDGADEPVSPAVAVLLTVKFGFENAHRLTEGREEALAGLEAIALSALRDGASAEHAKACYRWQLAFLLSLPRRGRPRKRLPGRAQTVAFVRELPRVAEQYNLDIAEVKKSAVRVLHELHPNSTLDRHRKEVERIWKALDAERIGDPEVQGGQDK